MVVASRLSDAPSAIIRRNSSALVGCWCRASSAHSMRRNCIAKTLGTCICFVFISTVSSSAFFSPRLGCWPPLRPRAIRLAPPGARRCSCALSICCVRGVGVGPPLYFCVLIFVIVIRRPAGVGGTSPGWSPAAFAAAAVVLASAINVASDVGRGNTRVCAVLLKADAVHDADRPPGSAPSRSCDGGLK